MKYIIQVAGLLCLLGCNTTEQGAPRAEAGRAVANAPEDIARAGVLSVDPATGKSCAYPDGSPLPPPVLSEEAMNSLDFGPMMARAYAELSPGDRSISAAALRQTDAVMLTSACSPNHVFWTHLSLVGMARPAELPLKADVPEVLRAGMRAFSFTDRGRQMLPGLLGSLERRRSDGEL